MYRVRGKRKKRLAARNEEARQPARYGRPMKCKEDTSVRRTVDSQRWCQSGHGPAAILSSDSNLSSQLEQLPNEIVQQIFFCCFEVNLPRASPRLAQALSKESIYRILILFAYFDDTGQHPVEEKLFRPAQYIRLRLEEKVMLQKAILTCRWLNLDRVKCCLPILSKLQMTQAWYAEKREEEAIYANLRDDGIDARLPVVASHDLLQPIAPLPERDDIDGQIRHFAARSRFLTEYDTVDRNFRFPAMTEIFLPRIITWSTDLVPAGDSETRLCKGLKAGCSTIAARVLPDWLLSGRPWTQGKIELLQLFRQGLQFIQEGNVLELSVAMLFEGMASAIREKQYVALLSLVELHDFTFVKWSSNGDSESVARSRHPLPPYLFHMASRADVASSQMMWLLIRADLDAISKDDSILLAWMLKGRALGDRVAECLFMFTSDTSTFSTYGSSNKFKHGRLISTPLTIPLPMDNATFGEELGYLRGWTDVRLRNLQGDTYG